MKFDNPSHWKEFKEREALLFLAQLLNEMLFDYTIDTYKPNALNVHSLIHEAMRISFQIKAGIIKEGNFTNIRDELKLSLNKDIALKSALREKHQYYSKLVGSSNNHEELYQVLESLHYYLSGKKYFTLLKNTLLEEVKKGCSKSNIFSVARALITEVLEYDYEKSYIYSQVNSIFFDPDKEIKDLTSLNSFLNLFNFKTSKYQVIFKCTPNYFELKDTLIESGFKITKKLKKNPSSESIKKFVEPNEEHVFIIDNEIEGLDHASARMESEGKLKFATDLFILYSHQTGLDIKSDAYIKSIDEGYTLIMSRTTDAIKKAKNIFPQEAVKAVSELKKNMTLNRSCVIKFSKAIQLHRLAMEAKELENQLLDLWAILETIIEKQPNSNKDRIVQIVDSIAPYLSINYLEKLFIELLKDLRNWNSEEIDTYLQSIDIKGEQLDKLSYVLSVPSQQNKLEELLEKLSEFPLLKNRLWTYNLWCTKDNELLHLLERHYTKVSWQIRRIYRARNSIIHNGDHPNQIEILVENLHSYVDILLTNISDMIINSQGESIAQSIIETKIQYNSHIDYLTKNKKTETDITNFRIKLFGK